MSQRKFKRLQEKVSKVNTYEKLCDWVADSIKCGKLWWPLYYGSVLGQDSTGGTDAAAYVEMNHDRMLTIDSQDGNLSAKEMKIEKQFSYVELWCPIKDETKITKAACNKLRIFKRSSLLSEWKNNKWSEVPENTDPIVLTYEKYEGKWHPFSCCDFDREECEVEFFLNEIKRWTSQTGHMFPEELASSIAQQNLHEYFIICTDLNSYPLHAAELICRANRN